MKLSFTFSLCATLLLLFLIFSFLRRKERFRQQCLGTVHPICGCSAYSVTKYGELIAPKGYKACLTRNSAPLTQIDIWKMELKSSMPPNARIIADVILNNPRMIPFYTVKTDPQGGSYYAVYLRFPEGALEKERYLGKVGNEPGYLTETLTDIGGKASKDIRSAMSFFEDPFEYTCQWFTDFMNTDPNAAKIKDKIAVVEDEQTKTKTKLVLIGTDGKITPMGTVSDSRIGKVRLQFQGVGGVIPVGDLFGLIGGPTESFRYRNRRGIFDTIGNWLKGAAESTISWVKGAGQTIATQIVEAGKSVGSFAQGVFRKVAETANSTMQIVKDKLIVAGEFVVRNATVVATAIKDTANTVAVFSKEVYEAYKDLALSAGDWIVNTANTIKDFFVDFGKMVVDAFNSLVNFIKTNIGKVWDFIKNILSTTLNLISGGLLCSYLLEKQTDTDQSTKTVIGILSPYIREPFKTFCIQMMNLLIPGISLLWPILQPLVNPLLDPELNNLLYMTLRPNVRSLESLLYPVLKALGSSCDFTSPPAGIADYDKIVDTTDFSKTGEPVIIMVADELTEL